MDDILQRLLAAEKEAEALVTEKSADGRRILEEARVASLQEQKEAQAALAAECAAERERILAAATAERDSRLAQSESQLSAELEQFRGKVDAAYPRIVRRLSGME